MKNWNKKGHDTSKYTNTTNGSKILSVDPERSKQQTEFDKKFDVATKSNDLMEGSNKWKKRGRN